ncbi:MAG: type I DNA topoisomerase [Clostridia bacterium]|nr:type I DNA topoisomerase [Clostridia bacterium]
MDLIIVESPSKAKTISKYLKGKYKVDASSGHVRDLPEKTIGVSITNNFEPKYVVSPGKKETIERLAEQAKKADRVYLATDPDREGEAISWHLQTVLGLDKEGENRIEFNEISPSAVQKALTQPRKINYNLVDAQQARRVLDRLVGYKLSPLLNNRIQNGLSAGRVQSVALRLIVDREREITAFVPEEYWTFAAMLQDVKKEYAPFKATYQLKKNGESLGKELAEEVESKLKNAAFTVTKVKKGVSKQHAPAPFTTSGLQQDASNKFGMTSPETMLIAQHLYEGMDLGGDHIALITYIRTDSVRVSQDAQKAALEHIEKHYGKEYVPAKPNYYATKKGAQDAHEAIRPINLEVTPSSLRGKLDKKHFNIYKLIYDRFVASQMAEAQYNTMQIECSASDYVFKASGRALLFAGYTKAYQDAPKEKEDDEESAGLFPPLNEGDELLLNSLTKEQKFTRPPSRYTDASLVKAMEEKGIGRPSTYASIISVLTKRRYVVKDGKYMVPTEVAYKITDMLVQYFTDIMDVGFTAHMEDELDKIEDGGVDWHKIIADFYPGFAEKLKTASTDGDEPTDIKCEKCGSNMIRRIGKYGKYLACSNYPACSNIVSESINEISEMRCPKCGANMLVKSGKFGKFLACPNYPECSAILPLDAKVTEEKCLECGAGNMILKKGRYGSFLECFKCGARRPTASAEEAAARFDGICPDCGKPMLRRRSKTGKIFYGCTGYPECKFLSWDITTGEKCPKCNAYLILRGDKIKCSSKDCDYSVAAPKEEKKPSSGNEN